MTLKKKKGEVFAGESLCTEDSIILLFICFEELHDLWAEIHFSWDELLVVTLDFSSEYHRGRN